MKYNMKKELKSQEIKPSAFIVSPKDKGRKPIKGGNIYLDDNENFEIELFNPLKVNILADIRLNGQSISKTGLIVKPGQRFYLDCFVDDKKKFTFQTYHVDGTTESQNAIADNGLMEVFFYKEDVVTLQNWVDKYRQTVVKEYYPIYIDRYPQWYPYSRPAYPYYGTISGGSIGSNVTLGGGLYGSSVTMCSGSLNSIKTSSTNYTNTIAGNYNFASSAKSELINDGAFNSSSLETGRIERGTASNQQFVEVDMDFEKNYIHHIVYQLLPISRKPVERSTEKVHGELVNKTQTLLIGHQAVDLIKKLKDLVDGGIITQTEFEDKKKELLSRI